MKVSRGDYGRLWLVLDDGNGLSQEAAVAAVRVPREVLAHFAAHGTLPPGPGPYQPDAERRQEQ